MCLQFGNTPLTAAVVGGHLDDVRNVMEIEEVVLEAEKQRMVRRSLV